MKSPNLVRKMPLPAFTTLFDTDEKCRAYLEKAIWNGTPACRHCGSVKAGRITGDSARKGLFQCYEKGCEKQFTVTVNTVFHDTHLPLPKWFLAIYLLSETTKGVSANWLKEAIGVTYKTAWYLGHRIRRLMAEENVLLTGIVEVDETYMGGKPRKGDMPAKRGRGTTKYPVFVAASRNGKVKAATVENNKFKNIKEKMEKWIADDATIISDEYKTYNNVGKFWKYHFRVQHGIGQYAVDGLDGTVIHTNTAESFNATLKRAHTGVYHYMSKKHLIRYVEEAVFRWNNRVQTTLGRLGSVLIASEGRHMPYGDLIAPI